MSRLDPGSYLEALEVSLSGNPQAQQDICEAKNSCLKRHWFEMSEALLRALKYPEILSIAFDLHDYAIMPTRADFSPTTYSKLLYLIVFSTSMTATAPLTPAEVTEECQKGLKILDSATASLVANGYTQGIHCVNCIRSLVHMQLGSVLEAKRLLDIVSEFTATLQTHEIDPLLLALLYKSRIREYELGRQYGKFYQTVFDVINYSERSEMIILEAEMSALAYKTVIAALLSTETFNFGRLLMFAPFTSRLKGNSDAWLLQLVEICNEGDVVGFEAFVTVNSDAIRNIPDLHESLPKLQRKVRQMALLHLVFYTPAESRTFTFAALATRCCLPKEGVEELLLSALALKIIEGTLDGLEETIEVSWVQPRILSVAEIRELANRIGGWVNLVKETSKQVTELAKMIPQ